MILRYKLGRIISVCILLLATIELFSYAYLPNEDLSHIKIISLDDAINYKGKTIGTIGIKSTIYADDYILMPDTKEKVVYGKLLYSISSGKNKQILINWQHKAKLLHISDGINSFQFDIPIHNIRGIKSNTKKGKISYALIKGAYKPVSVKYYNYFFNIDAEQYPDIIEQNIYREVINVGQEVILVCGLRDGGIITKPKNGNFKIIATKGQKSPVESFSMSYLPLLLIIFAIAVWTVRKIKQSIG